MKIEYQVMGATRVPVGQNCHRVKQGIVHTTDTKTRALNWMQDNPGTYFIREVYVVEGGG